MTERATLYSSTEFKKIYDSWSQFRDNQYLWFRVAENTYDNFVYSADRAARR